MKKQWILIALILIGAFGVRLYRFNNPVADWHSWRQADTSAVSRNFVKYGFDMLHPRMNNISNVQSGLENPQGYFMAEFPLYNALQAGAYKHIGRFTIEEWGRLVSIIASLFGILAVYGLVKRHSDTLAALAAAFFYAFLPFSIYYSRTILPDALGIGLFLCGVYLFDVWIEKEKEKVKKGVPWFIGSLVTIAAAFLVRPHVLFFTPIFVYLVWQAWGISLFKKWQLYLFLILTILPFGMWRLWISHFPEGIPASAWLFNEGNIRFTGAFFYWLFAERMGRLILGYWGVSFLILGIVLKAKKGWGFFLTFFISTLLYYTVIARGNVQHDYYQYITVPSIAMLLGRGVSALLTLPKEQIHVWASRVTVVIVILFSLSFSWYYVRDYFNIDNPNLIAAGKVVDQMTPQDAKVIAPLDGDSSFLYQTNRQGWASFEHSLPDLIKMGAGYLVLVNPSPTDVNIGTQYRIVASSSAYLLFDLHQKPLSAQK